MAANGAHINVSQIGQFIRHQSCERRFRLEYNNRELARELPFAERLFNPLDPVLQAEGARREDQWEESLQDEGLTGIGPTVADDVESTRSREDGLAGEEAVEEDESILDSGEQDAMSWEIFEDWVRTLEPGEPAYAREVAVEGGIGAFHLTGQIDFLLVLWDEMHPYLRIVETKASRKDKTYQRIQVATYRLLVERLLDDQQLQLNRGIIGPEDLECAVARIDETTNRLEDILEVPKLELDSEIEDIHHLLENNGRFEGILDMDLENLDYQLNAKCDTCVFDVHCFPESARYRRLELLGIDPSSSRVLREERIENIDDLAQLELQGDRAQRIRSQQGFSANLESLQDEAIARRQMLPGGGVDPDEFEVMPLTHGSESQLPEHVMNGRRIVRIYLSVDYDYTENRVGALAAHITQSEGELVTDFHQDDEGNWRPDPEVRERVGPDGDERRQLQGEEVIRYKTSEWSGNFDRDTAAEAELIQSFLHDLIDAIAEVANDQQAILHFYVWSPSEITNLVEGCSRAGTQLLGHLRQLLGCREPIEQLIYSSLRDEVDSRFALGYTGRGLSVVTGLRWFGERYHWHRTVAGEAADLDHVFTQNIFDYKTELYTDDNGEWVPQETDDLDSHIYEIRSRFYDNLPAPYWRAVWGTLGEPDDFDSQKLRNAIQRYNRAARPRRLREYLRARTHSLRWVDERIRYKNDEIEKEALDVAELQRFDLEVEDSARAAIDFLLLDHHVRMTEWIGQGMQPPVHRVPEGNTIPLCDPTWDGGDVIEADIWLDGHDIGLEDLRDRTRFGEGSWVRLTPCSDDPHRGQTFGQLTRAGNTCIIDDIDWDVGTVELSRVYHPSTRYKLSSTYGGRAGDSVYEEGEHATLDENVCDFVAGRVHDKLDDHRGTHAYRWFDPENPAVPPVEPIEDVLRQQYITFLEEYELPRGYTLLESQREAILEGLDTRVHLVHGPPGTGKTDMSAIAVLLRIIDHHEPGDIVLLAGSTHRAADNLLARIDEYLESFTDAAGSFGFEVPEIQLHKAGGGAPPSPGVETFDAGTCIQYLDDHRQGRVLIVGGTTNGVLKMADSLSDSATFDPNETGYRSPSVFVDEASMMVLPHFLSLASLVQRDGRLMLAGDHRQLPPIVAHDWEEEDRPPVELYQPFTSAFEAVRNLSENDEMDVDSIDLSPLHFTFRLPPTIRALIARLYRTMDDLDLEGAEADVLEIPEDEADSLEAIWGPDTGLYLIVHDERESRQSNETEATIVTELLESAPDLQEDTVSVMTPHRAQQTLLTRRLEGFSGDGRPIDVISTVERLQGGESENIIVSATASDPTVISSRERFLLDLNRANVAFSRTQSRLFVICSRSLINHIAPEIEEYESAMLWKSLRSLCTVQIGEDEINGHGIEILVPNPDNPDIADILEGE